MACVAGGYGTARNDGFEAGQSVERGAWAITFVAGEEHIFEMDIARRLVPDRLGGGHRKDLAIEQTGCLSGGGTLLRLESVEILRLTADAVAFGNDFGGLDHGHIDVVMKGFQLLVDIDAIVARLDQRDRFLSAAGDDIHSVDDDLLGGGGDGHDA